MTRFVLYEVGGGLAVVWGELLGFTSVEFRGMGPRGAALRGEGEIWASKGWVVG
jgi:hypothetical protein